MDPRCSFSSLLKHPKLWLNTFLINNARPTNEPGITYSHQNSWYLCYGDGDSSESDMDTGISFAYVKSNSIRIQDVKTKGQGLKGWNTNFKNFLNPPGQRSSSKAQLSTRNNVARYTTMVWHASVYDILYTESDFINFLLASTKTCTQQDSQRIFNILSEYGWHIILWSWWNWLFTEVCLEAEFQINIRRTIKLVRHTFYNLNIFFKTNF